MATVNEKMTAIADKTRSITGETAKMGLDAIATNLTLAEAEVGSQADLIAQIATALEGKAGGSGSGGVEYEIVSITESTTQISFTLHRVTSTFGMMTASNQPGMSMANIAHQNLNGLSVFVVGGGSTQSFIRTLFFDAGSLKSSVNFLAPYIAIFINDPSQPAIYGA